MANNYTGLSFSVKLPTEAIAWAVKLAHVVNEWGGEETDGHLSEIEAECWGDTTMFAAAKEMLGPDLYGSGCVWHNDDDILVVWYEESADIEVVAEIIQRTLARFTLPDTVAFEWASWCSAPRYGEFGGGAVIVTATEMHWLNTGTWIAERLHALETVMFGEMPTADHTPVEE